MTKQEEADLVTSYDFVDSMVDRADAYSGPAPLWHGWALREAFLAGVKRGREKAANAPAPAKEPTTCGFCTYEEADGGLIEQCEACYRKDAQTSEGKTCRSG